MNWRWDKKVATEKVGSVKTEIGFARELLDNKKLVTFYEHFPDVKENKYYETICELNKALNYKNKKRLWEPVDKSDWTLHVMPAIVNAFYYRSENRITIPAGILQDVFFNYDRPQYMNYGGIGFHDLSLKVFKTNTERRKKNAGNDCCSIEF